MPKIILVLSRISGYVANKEWVLEQMTRFIGSSPVVTTNKYNIPTMTLIVIHKI
jgi:hypothetical protein